MEKPANYIGVARCGPGKRKATQKKPRPAIPATQNDPPKEWRCPRCQSVNPRGHTCKTCEDNREAVMELLEICSDDECGEYDTDGRHRCGLLAPNSCRLMASLVNGWRCPKGYHDEK